MCFSTRSAVGVGLWLPKTRRLPKRIALNWQRRRRSKFSVSCAWFVCPRLAAMRVFSQRRSLKELGLTHFVICCLKLAPLKLHCTLLYSRHCTQLFLPRISIKLGSSVVQASLKSSQAYLISFLCTLLHPMLTVLFRCSGYWSMFIPGI